MSNKTKNPKNRSFIALSMILRTGNHAGKHHNREYDTQKGRTRKPKHKKPQEIQD
jgi:hypothetical protein